MKIKRFNLGRLFYNNKVVMLFSVIIAFIFWIILSTSASESTTKLITDIPISVSLSESAKEEADLQSLEQMTLRQKFLLPEIG